MGLSLEFYAGNAETIGAAITAIDLDSIRDGEKAIGWADFSLHVSIDDLNLLSQSVAEHLGRLPLFLLDSLTRTVGSMEEDGGSAELVDPAWVAMVAALEPSDADRVATDWMRRVGEEIGKTLEPPKDASTAVDALILLCRKAVAARADVVLVWYL